MGEADPEVFRILQLEERRQVEDLKSIASENYASPAVLENLNTAFSNKYSEGVMGKR